jgi:hypothetical protein
MNNRKNLQLARRIIRFLCDGCQIDGLRFGPNFQLLITPERERSDHPHGQVYLNLSKNWALCRKRSSKLCSPPRFTSRSHGEKLRVLCRLQNRVIERAEITSPQLHLYLYLDGRTLLALNGCDNTHHWDLGVAFALSREEEWNVMVYPDGRLEVSCPRHFSRAVMRST